MTKQEKIIVSAYTGVLMCDFGDVHGYVEEKLGRPIFTHEFADKDIQEEIKEKSKEDFLKICNREEPEHKTGKWIHHEGGYSDHYECTACGKAIVLTGRCNYCPNCGSYNGGEDNGDK